MDMEKHGLRELTEDQKKQIHALHMEIESLIEELAATRNALAVAQGQLRLYHQDRDFDIAA